MAFYMNMMALNEARTKEEYEAEKRKKRNQESIRKMEDENRIYNRMEKKSNALMDKANPHRYTKDTMETLAMGKAIHDTQKSEDAKGADAKDAIMKSGIAGDAAARNYRRHGASPKKEKELKQFNRDIKNNKVDDVYAEQGIFSECYFLDEE